MAKLVKKGETEKVPLTIEFTVEELEVLSVIFAKVGGPPEGYRGVVDGLARLLSENNYGNYRKNKVYGKLSETSEVYFND